MEQITEPEKDNEIWKYWKQRYQLFHKYDEGILLDHEGWFSVTPQAIAEHVAQRCRCNIIVDPFAGCGGNVIQLAQTCNQVIAIDIDPEKIRLARHNARIYGVEHRIEWIVGDSLQILPTLKADVVFLSPPWGGPAYERGNGGFRLKDMMIKDTSGIDLFALARKVSHNIAYFLPKTTSVEEFEALCDEKDAELEVEYAYLNGGMKLITGYYGDLAKRENI
jgi:trimethylguanosine synthase